MDLLEATETDLKKKIGTTDCTFTFLCAYDRASLLREDLKARQEAWNARREKLIANLDSAGITGPQRFEELEAFEDRAPQGTTEQDWISFVNDPLNEPKIYAVSLRPTHDGQADELANRARLTLAEKAKVCGLTLVTVPDEQPEKREKPDPNAEIPAAYGTPGPNSTGQTPKPESDTGMPQ